MKIVSWNCRNGFEKEKQEALFREFPVPETDVFVIQECRIHDLDETMFDWNCRKWYGDDQDEKSDIGIAVFSGKHRINFTKKFNRKYRYVVPFEVAKDGGTFTLFAVWTKSDKRGLYNYDQNVIEAVRSPDYECLVRNNAVVIGDFNTFAKKDNGRLQTLEDTMRPLINCASGTPFRETCTYYHNDKDKYGQDDFCFASEDIMKKKIAFNVYSDWKNNRWNGSDHCPISVEFEL